MHWIAALLAALWALLNMRIGRTEKDVDKLDTEKLDKTHFDSSIASLHDAIKTMDSKNDAGHDRLHQRIDDLHPPANP